MTICDEFKGTVVKKDDKFYLIFDSDYRKQLLDYCINDTFKTLLPLYNSYSNFNSTTSYLSFRSYSARKNVDIIPFGDNMLLELSNDFEPYLKNSFIARIDNFTPSIDRDLHPGRLIDNAKPLAWIKVKICELVACMGGENMIDKVDPFIILGYYGLEP